MTYKKKRLLTIIIACSVFGVFGIAGIVLASTGVMGRLVRNPQGEISDTLPPPPPPRTVTIAAVGDIMMGTDFPAPRLPPQDGALLFAEAGPILRAADIAFGNLEGPITSSRSCAKDVSRKHTFAFRSPPRLARNLATAGFDVMSLANNHSRDFGYAGMADTKRILDSLGIKYSSKEGEVASFEVDGLKVGLIALTTGSSPRSILNIEMCRKEVAELAPGYDVLIVSFHGGSEGTAALHTYDKFENLFGEPRGNVVQFAHAMIDAGADVIIGHGPHVPRGIEIYKDRVIAYSLGNYCTYRCMQLVAELGYAPLLVVEVDSAGRFLRGQIHSFTQSPPGGPKTDTTEKAFNLMRTLSIADFGRSAPLFSESLNFYPPADSGLTEEDIQALRDSLDALAMLEPDSTEPEVSEAVDSFLTALSDEADSLVAADSTQTTLEQPEEEVLDTSSEDTLPRDLAEDSEPAPVEEAEPAIEEESPPGEG